MFEMHGGGGQDNYYELLVKDELLYATQGYDGLTIFDISNPIEPVVLSNTPVPEGTGIANLNLFENYLYAAGRQDLYVFNVSDPENPSIVEEFHNEDGDNQFRSSQIRDDYLYIASFRDSEILIFNIADPANITEAGSITTPMNPTTVVLQDSILLVSGLRDVDIAIFSMIDPTTFEPRGTWEHPDRNISSHSMVVKDTIAFITGDGVQILDISDIDNIEYLSTTEAEPVQHLAIKNEHLYMTAGGTSWFWLYDVSNPTNTEEIAHYLAGGGLYADIVPDESGRYVYCVLRRGGDDILIVFDCIEAVGYTFSFDLHGNRFELVSSTLQADVPSPEAVFGGLSSLVFAYQNNGDIYIPGYINTIDAINPGQGYLLFNQDDEVFSQNGQRYEGPITTYIPENQWSWLGYPYWEALPVETVLNFLYDEIAIIMDDEGNFNIPYELSTLDSLRPGNGYYLFSYFDWDFTFPYPDEPDEEGVVVGNHRLTTSSARVPLLPTQSTVQKTGKPYLILISLTEELHNLNPSVIEIYDGELLVGVATVDNQSERVPVIAWQGDAEHGLEGFRPGNKIIVKVVDSDSRFVGNNQPASTSSDVDEQGESVNERGEEVDEYNRSATSEDVAESQVSSVFSVSSVVKPGSQFGEGPYAEITVSASTTAEASLPGGFTLGTVYPNPFNSTLTVPFTLPEQSEVRFQLYNTLGQLQFEQVGMYPSGQQRFTVDAGEELVSGVYFLKVQTGSKNAVQKVILLK
ncbi:T9SS type A sorting domain-containing protein [bacterium]|nr:T9SS type A sorting domain-containing protein [bacterium]